MVVHALNISPWEARAGRYSEFEASQVHIASSHPARVIGIIETLFPQEGFEIGLM